MTIVLAIAFWCMTILHVITSFKLWRAPASNRRYERPPWWLWGEAPWSGYRRALVPASLVLVCFATALSLPDPAGVYFGLMGLVVFLPLVLAVALFTRPKILVPPSLRDTESRRPESRHGISNGDPS